MNKKTTEKIETAIQDCLDKAWACTENPEDLSNNDINYLGQAERLGKILIENQKVEYEKEIELQKIELEKQKYADSSDLKNWRFWVKTLVVPVTSSLIILAAKENAVLRMAKIASEFEATNTWSTSMGKGVGRFVSDSSLNLFRDRA